MTRVNLPAVMDRLAGEERLHGPGRFLAGLTEGRDGALLRVARGAGLGHALHPALTDLPIGCWTSAWLLDIGGMLGRRRRARRAAADLVLVGVLTAAPTVVTGIADAPRLSESKRRIAVVHASANALATMLYLVSFVLRRRRREAAGIAVGMLGAASATLGGILGGHLALGEDAGVTSGRQGDQRSKVMRRADVADGDGR